MRVVVEERYGGCLKSIACTATIACGARIATAHRETSLPPNHRNKNFLEIHQFASISHVRRAICESIRLFTEAQGLPPLCPSPSSSVIDGTSFFKACRIKFPQKWFQTRIEDRLQEETSSIISATTIVASRCLCS